MCSIQVINSTVEQFCYLLRPNIRIAFHFIGFFRTFSTIMQWLDERPIHQSLCHPIYHHDEKYNAYVCLRNLYYFYCYCFRIIYLLGYACAYRTWTWAYYIKTMYGFIYIVLHYVVCE